MKTFKDFFSKETHLNESTPLKTIKLLGAQLKQTDPEIKDLGKQFIVSFDSLHLVFNKGLSTSDLDCSYLVGVSTESSELFSLAPKKVKVFSDLRKLKDITGDLKASELASIEINDALILSELDDDVKYVLGKKEGKYIRIISTRSVNTSIGVVPPRVEGGLVRGDFNLSQAESCWIFDDSIVRGGARVNGNAIVKDKSEVFDDARVFGNARVQDSKIYGEARIFDKADVRSSSISGDVSIFGKAIVKNYEVSEDGLDIDYNVNG